MFYIQLSKSELKTKVCREQVEGSNAGNSKVLRVIYMELHGVTCQGVYLCQLTYHILEIETQRNALVRLY